MRPIDSSSSLMAATLLLLFTINIATVKASPLSKPGIAREQAQLSVEEIADLIQLERPMHTTALMAGEAMALSERVREQASRTAAAGSAPTKSTSAYDIYEL